VFKPAVKILSLASSIMLEDALFHAARKSSGRPVNAKASMSFSVISGNGGLAQQKNQYPL